MRACVRMQYVRTYGWMGCEAVLCFGAEYVVSTPTHPSTLAPTQPHTTKSQNNHRPSHTMYVYNRYYDAHVVHPALSGPDGRGPKRHKRPSAVSSSSRGASSRGGGKRSKQAAMAADGDDGDEDEEEVDDVAVYAGGVRIPLLCIGRAIAPPPTSPTRPAHRPVLLL